MQKASHTILSHLGSIVLTLLLAFCLLLIAQQSFAEDRPPTEDGTIEVVYTNNGYNEDAFRDMFPAFAQGGEFTGPGGERARIEYIPMYSVPSSNVIGMRRVREEEDPFHRHEKNTDRYPRRAVQLINNWDSTQILQF